MQIENNNVRHSWVIHVVHPLKIEKNKGKKSSGLQ